MSTSSGIEVGELGLATPGSQAVWKTKRRNPAKVRASTTEPWQWGPGTDDWKRVLMGRN
jgi:hypothetical protein